jgi:hypothetical protein
MVFAGTVNGDGLLEVQTTKLAEDTMLAQIINMVGDAQSKRAPSEMWVEKVRRDLHTGRYDRGALDLCHSANIFWRLVVGLVFIDPWCCW